jgi:23S rRNA pseudouridine1911/1915/1917 synthase
MAVVDLTKNQGKSAKTEVELLQNSTQGCLVRCTLHTGRTHQIRVHMAFLGHPLVADEVYAGLKAAGMNRQALHAYRLAFTHPETFELMQFTSEVPMDFRAALAEWGLSYNEK